MHCSVRARIRPRSSENEGRSRCCLLRERHEGQAGRRIEIDPFAKVRRSLLLGPQFAAGNSRSENDPHDTHSSLGKVEQLRLHPFDGPEFDFEARFLLQFALDSLGQRFFELDPSARQGPPSRILWNLVRNPAKQDPSLANEQGVAVQPGLLPQRCTSGTQAVVRPPTGSRTMRRPSTSSTPFPPPQRWWKSQPGG